MVEKVAATKWKGGCIKKDDWAAVKDKCNDKICHCPYVTAGGTGCKLGKAGKHNFETSQNLF